MDDALEARRLHHARQLPAAAERYRAALAANPGDALLAHDYAMLLLQCGDHAAALPLLRGIPAHAACHPQALLARAHAHRALGQLNEGIEAASHASRLMPSHPIPWLLLGSQQVMAGLHAEAEAGLRRALSIAPDLGEAWHYLGESLQARGHYADAAAAYRQAARAQPTEALNIGICAELQGDLESARGWYIEMERLAPGRFDTLVRLAHVCAQLCRMDECETVAARIRSLDGARGGGPLPPGIEPFPLTYLPLTDDFKQRALAAHARPIRARAATMPPLAAAPAPGSRLRLGYVSPDLGRHAVGTLLRHHLEAHDRSRFEVSAYSLRRFDDPVAAGIAAGVEHFVDASEWSDHALARRIRDDGIDVLIDLGGYTHGARPVALAMRPAPLQLGWLGLIHAQEAPWLDGIILDETSAPAAAPWPYGDRVYRMHSPLLPGWPLQRPPADRARFGLPPADVPVLASFNNGYKLDRALVEAWARILDAAPAAWILVFLREPQARAGFIATWQAAGGDASRLQLAETLPFAEQLVRAASCDLFLDAFRYQAGATGVMSMAAGLPILGLAGHHPLSRMGNALNHHLGLDELVAPDIPAYIAKAAELANSPARLADLRARMADRLDAGDLLSPRRTAAEIERIAESALHELRK